MVTRRNFFGGALAAGAVGLPGTGCVSTDAAFLGADGVLEPAREVRIAGDADIIVAGGGPAGISAAIGAARQGAKVVLLEAKGTVGGIWTNGLLGCLIGFNSSGFDREILARLDRYRARRDRRPKGDLHCFVYEPEYMKVVCEELLAEAGVRIRLGTSVVAAVKDASGRNLKAVITESKSGREAWTARKFVDCTGDGDLAALAGCGYDLGYFPDGTGQPATLNALVVVRDEKALKPYVSNDPAMWDTRTKTHIPSSHAFRDVLRKVGLEPSYSDPTLWQLHGNLLELMANHEYRLPLDDAEAITKATVHARRELFEMVKRLDALGGPWKGIRLAATAEQIGHREARRIHGRYTVTREDVAKGAKFEDALTRSNFGIDIHGLDMKANLKKAAGGNMGAAFKPFEIPLRACIAKDADNLYMAGRNISGDFIAHASYRVTGSSVALGEGVGKAIAKRLSK